jgi:hypothetical protein
MTFEPHLAVVAIERVERTASGVRVWVCPRVQTAVCPFCGTAAAASR